MPLKNTRAVLDYLFLAPGKEKRSITTYGSGELNPKRASRLVVFPFGGEIHLAGTAAWSRLIKTGAAFWWREDGLRSRLKRG